MPAREGSKPSVTAWLGNELTEGLPHGVNVRVGLLLTHGVLGVTVL